MTAPWHEKCKYCGEVFFMTLGYPSPYDDLLAIIEDLMKGHYAQCPKNPENQEQEAAISFWFHKRGESE